MHDQRGEDHGEDAELAEVLVRDQPGFYRKFFGFSDLYDGEEGIQYQIVSASYSASPLASGGYFICPSSIRM